MTMAYAEYKQDDNYDQQEQNSDNDRNPQVKMHAIPPWGLIIIVGRRYWGYDCRTLYF